MHLSQLTLNPTNRHVQADIASPYELHRTIMRAFPDADAGGPGRVLFRVEQRNDDYGNVQPVVLVQSENKPDWSHVTSIRELATYALRVEERPFAPKLRSGQRLTFRLRANPTVKREGKRHGLWEEEEQLRWIARKGESGGFKVQACRVIHEQKAISCMKSKGNGHSAATFFAVRFDGILEVTNVASMLHTLRTGVGSAKGFGFGLLSVAPTPT